MNKISWKSVYWEPCCSMWTDRWMDTRTDRQTEMTKLIVFFGSFAKEPINQQAIRNVDGERKQHSADVPAQRNTKARYFRCCKTHWKISALLSYKIVYNTMGGNRRFERAYYINPLNPELNPICYLLALLAHHFLHVSRIMVKSLPLRLLMSYTYIYIYIYIYIWSTYSGCF